MNDSPADGASTAATKRDRNQGVGRVMRQLRKDANVTQAAVAAAMGLERTSVCNIESGHQTLTIEKLHAFARCVQSEVVITFRSKVRRRGAVSCILDATDTQ